MLSLIFAPAASASAITWSSQVGGNDHYYEAFAGSTNISWTDASQLAGALGGYLATVPTAQENSFVFSLIDDQGYWDTPPTAGGRSLGPWLGGRRQESLPDPNAGWGWVTGETWGYTNWAPGEPNFSDEDFLQYWSFTEPSSRQPTWNNSADVAPFPVFGYVVEWNSQPVPESSALVLGLAITFVSRRPPSAKPLRGRRRMS
jgi:hypothetical protein